MNEGQVFLGTLTVMLAVSYIQSAHLLDIIFVVPQLLAAALITAASFEKNALHFIAYLLAGLVFVFSLPYFVAEIFVFSVLIGVIFMAKRYIFQYTKNDYLLVFAFSVLFVAITAPTLLWANAFTVFAQAAYSAALAYLFSMLFAIMYRPILYAKRYSY